MNNQAEKRTVNKAISLPALGINDELVKRFNEPVNASGLMPLGHAVLVQTYEPEVQSSVIHIPEQARGRMQMVEQRCLVIAVGPGCWEGETAARAKPGDKVLVTKYAGYVTSQTKDGQTYRLVNDRDVFCRIDWSD